MKNLITGILIAGLLIVAGCGQAQSKPQKETPSEPVEVDQTVVEIDLQVGDEQYREEIATASAELSSYMYDFSDLNMQASNNPIITYNEDWIYETAVTIVAIQGSIADFRAIEPPLHLQAVHDEILLAMDEFEQSTNKYVEAIDYDNWDLLDESLNHLDKGTEHIEKATFLLNGE